MFLTLFGHDAATWTAWGTWLYTLVTFVLAVGAIGAWRNSRRQLSTMEAARKDSQRPLVISVAVIGHLDYDEEVGPSWTMSARVRNIGVGPALEVVARVWLETRGALLPERRPSGSYSDGPFLRRDSDCASSPIALAAGAEVALELLKDGWVQAVDVPDPLTKHVAFCVVDYRDVYGRHFRYPNGQSELADAAVTAGDYLQVIEVTGN